MNNRFRRLVAALPNVGELTDADLALVSGGEGGDGGGGANDGTSNDSGIRDCNYDGYGGGTLDPGANNDANCPQDACQAGVTSACTS